MIWVNPYISRVFSLIFIGFAEKIVGSDEVGRKKHPPGGKAREICGLWEDLTVELDLQRFYNINRRVLMWIAFFGILILLRHFFVVMFLTFIIGFVMRNIAKFLTSDTRIPYRAAVVIPYLIAVGLLILLMTTAIPRVVDEGIKFSRETPVLLKTLAKEVKQTANKYGFETTLAKYVNAGFPLSPPTTQEGTDFTATQPSSDSINIDAMTQKMQSFLLRFLTGMIGEEEAVSLPDIFIKFVGGVIGGMLHFLLAVLLSFLIVLDFEAIANELKEWRQSTVGRFFQEASASVVEFSAVVGKAFQCQIVVALLNAAITCIGLVILQIEPLLLLTTIVFIFGLIPVLGVFISSVPIILIAFNTFGILHALLALGMIVIVHLLEAYVFNPRIYAARFHLNPVIVLIILLLAHELFGIWGMLLGIPVTHYVLNIAQMPSLPRKTRRQKNTTIEPT
ncbi:MAG: AI-2E family transporter [Planctomycetota bacterium]|nr:MAG: AI-2E family transporter [Planctomycetota bacterium]